ncbi:hypothetical protein C0J52_04242 [Blattella germanica]|nr:hypothetical protein C0J52_04242 [Blattella germanica]
MDVVVDKDACSIPDVAGIEQIEENVTPTASPSKSGKNSCSEQNVNSHEATSDLLQTESAGRKKRRTRRGKKSSSKGPNGNANQEGGEGISKELPAQNSQDNIVSYPFLPDNLDVIVKTIAKLNTNNIVDGSSTESPHQVATTSNCTTPIKKTKKKKNKKNYYALGSNQRRSKKNKNNADTSIENMTFEEYILPTEATEGIQKKFLISGNIRINPKCYTEAYINAPDKGQDILIMGMRDRNRALEGDEVLIFLNPSSQWKVNGSNRQRTGKVVFIKDKIHPRVAVGFLRPFNSDWGLFSPRDARIPRIRIPMSKCPENFLEKADQYKSTMFLARIDDWQDVKYAVGKECIFTIDPLTARDLDDAVSCKRLENGNFLVGVHISDVSFFLKEGTPLDHAVSNRATSTYLVASVQHMLPKEMCLLCSLLPGEDKLAFSVFWEMTPEAEIIRHYFTRSVINSCTQLAYEHAQAMLENPSKDWKADELPKIFGNYSPTELSCVVNQLNTLAVVMRGKRFSGGALRIDQPKLVFSLDPGSGYPISFTMHEQRESNRMIEEFMLLANMTVAAQLNTDFPDLAFLRCHPPPHAYVIDKLRESLEHLGIFLDVSSAGGLQNSMWRYGGSDFVSKARMMVLNNLCAKPMARAKIAATCNKQKYLAKRAGEKSIELYLSIYIAMHGPMCEVAVVMDIKDVSFDVIICKMGLVQRIYTNNMSKQANVLHKKEGDRMIAQEIHWKPTEESPCIIVQRVEMFSIVEVKITSNPITFKIESYLRRPSVAGGTLPYLGCEESCQ